MVLLLNLYQDLNTILIYFSHYKAYKYLLHLEIGYDTASTTWYVVTKRHQACLCQLRLGDWMASNVWRKIRERQTLIHGKVEQKKIWNSMGRIPVGDPHSWQKKNHTKTKRSQTHVGLNLWDKIMSIFGDVRPVNSGMQRLLGSWSWMPLSWDQMWYPSCLGGLLEVSLFLRVYLLFLKKKHAHENYSSLYDLWSWFAICVELQSNTIMTSEVDLLSWTHRRKD
jgi:hypothetical protein